MKRKTKAQREDEAKAALRRRVHGDDKGWA